MKEIKYLSINILVCIISTIGTALYGQVKILSGMEEFTPDQLFFASLAANGEISQITGKFRETKHFEVLQDDAVSEGEFTIRGGEIELRYTKPEGNMIIIGQEKFTIINNGNRQSVKMDANPMMRHFSGVIAASMGGEFELPDKESDIRYLRNNGEYAMEITPSDKRILRYMKRIILIFDKENLTLNRFRIYEDEADYTEYLFFGKSITK